MAIHIQSRGKNQDQDYLWLRIKENGIKPQTPDYLQNKQTLGVLSVKLSDLVESQKCSVILVKAQRYFCLLITGLRARGRNDFQGRQIRNSLFWLCDTKDIDKAEAKMRSLLVLALRGELEKEIDLIINNSDNKYGFEVNYPQLQELINDIKVESNNNTDVDNKIGNNSDNSKQELALELETNPLPDREGLLVLVTSIKSASALQQTLVWRGLSNRVEFEEFKTYYPLATNSQQGQKKTPYLGLAIALLLIIVISIAIIHFLKLQKPQPEINPNYPILQKQSQNLSSKTLTSTELLRY